MTSPRGYDAGTAFLAVIPSFRGVQQAIEREVRGIERALGKKSGEEFGKAFNEGGGQAIDRLLGTQRAQKAADKAGKEAGKAYAGAFSGHVKDAVGRAQREIRSTIKLTSDDKDVQRSLRGISNELNKIAKAKIGVDMDAGAALAKVEEINAAITELQRDARSIDLGVNTATAQAAIERARKAIKDLNDINVTIEPKLESGHFARSLRSQIDAAVKRIPELKFDADVTGARSRLQEIRREMIQLSGKKIDIDISASGALAEMERLRRELAILATDTEIDVQVRTDAAGAAKDLVEIRTLAELVDKTRVEIKVDVDVDKPITGLNRLRRAMHEANKTGGDGAGAFRLFNIQVLGVAAGLPLVAPLAFAAAGAIGFLASAALGALAGLGALVLAFSGIGSALKSMQKLRDDEAKKALKNSQAIGDANRKVESAERNLADARNRSSQASRAVADAVGQQEDAERDLVRAQADVVRAQERVNDAREEARERIEDLQLSIRGGALAEREAALDLKDAEKELRESDATGDERERLIINLEQAKLRVDQLRESNADMAAEQAEFNRTGINGSEEVQSAQEGVAAAQQGVQDAMERVADAAVNLSQAQADAAQTSLENARAVEDAQRDLADAERERQEAIFKGTRAGSQAFADMQAELDQLGPAGKHFAYFIDGMRDKFHSFRNTVQAGFFPGLEDAILRITTVNGPVIYEFLRNMGNALGDLSERFGRLMTSNQWQEIWASFAHYAPIYMEQFGNVGLSMLTFFGELFRGLGPYTERFGAAVEGIASDVADWAAVWTRSSEFSQTMEWLFTTGAQVWETLLNVGEAIWNILVGLEPLGVILLTALDGIAQFIAALDPTVVGAVATAIAGVIISLQLAAAAWAALYGGVRVLSNSVTGVIFIIGLIATALIILYNSSDDWRAIIDSVFGILGKMASFVGSILAPILEALATLFGDLSGFLGDNVELATALFFAIGAWAAWGTVVKVVAALTGFLGVLPGRLLAARDAALLSRGAITGFLAAVAIGYSVYTNAIDLGKKWADGLREGGRAAEEARAALSNFSTAFSAANEGGAGWINALAGPGGQFSATILAMKAAKDATKELWQEMSPLERAEAKVAEWTATLRYNISKYGENSDETAAAERRLKYWTGELRGEQVLLNDALSGTNEALAAQQGFIIALTEVQIAYDQSLDSLASAHKDLAEAQAEANADGVISAEEQLNLARLTEQLTNQTLSTAKAAGQVAATRYANLPDAEREQRVNAALLADLQRQREEYGSLPPELEEMAQGLEALIDPALIAAANFDALSLSVVSVPDSKSIIVESTTEAERARLEELGYTVEELPDGSFKVTASTDEAQAAIDQLLKDRDMNIFVHVNKNPTVDRSNTGGMSGNLRQYTAQLAGGGSIRGPGGPTDDAIPIWASDGEYMIKAASVRKYGLAFFDMINAGAYAAGGHVKRKMKDGRPRYDTGGLVANWGGAISIPGGDVSALALVWVDAVRDINALAGLGAALIAQQFANMRNAAVAQLTALRNSAGGILRGMNLDIGTTSKTAISQWVQGYVIYRRTVELLFQGMRDNLVARTNEQNLTMVRNASTTTRAITLLFQAMQTAVTTAVGNMVGAVGTHFARLPSLTAAPVNVVIDKVLNRGLFAAFNRIVIELGLNKEWTISPAAGVTIEQSRGGSRLAAGGRVPGWSPHDKADNIHAMLTAGEWVQPVDAVDYYGPEFMEAIRKRLIPREALQYRATGGEIYAKTLTAFPRAKLNSSYRPGDPGLHGSNQAADMGEAGFSGGIGRAYIAAMKRWWVDNFGATADEIIYNGAGADRPNIKNGASYPYPVSTQLEHLNHLHVGYTRALAGVTGGPSGTVAVFVPPSWYEKYGSADGVLKALEGSISAVDDIEAGRVGTMYGGLADKAVDFVWSKVGGTIASMFAGIMGQIQSALAPASGASGPVVDIVRSVASKYGWGEGNEWNALSQLISKESSWNPNAQNPTSTAYGLFQFLNSTWAGVGATKTSDPGLQSEAGMKYIQGRYGSPSRALAFHLQNNWYGEGGEVAAPADTAPTLFDRGGYLPPGITTVLNATKKPEPILTAEQWSDLTSNRGDGGSHQTIGELHLHQVQDSLEDAVAEVNHWANVYDKRGGRYAPVGG